MKTMMTDAELRQFVGGVQARVCEFFEGYVVVGLVAGSRQAVIIGPPADQGTALALNSLLVSAVRPVAVNGGGGAGSECESVGE